MKKPIKDFFDFIEEEKVITKINNILGISHKAELIAFLERRVPAEYMLDIIIRDLGGVEQVEFWVNLNKKWLDRIKA